MKIKKIVLFLVASVLCEVAVSAQTEADFVFDVATGTITGYTSWDTSITDITIPAAIGGKTVTAIEPGVFQNAGLISVMIPDGVIVQDGAFSGNKLTSVTLGADCRISEGAGFGYFAFFSYMCNSRKAGSYKVDAEWDKNWTSENADVWKTAEDYTYAETTYGLAITSYNGGAGRLSIPETLNGKPVKFIGLAGYDSGLTGIRISDSVVAIGDGAFSGASLSSGAFIGNGVTYIGDEAFSYTKLTSITIPNGVTYIGEKAFVGNRLTSVTIPASVTHIGDLAFGNNDLTSVTISEGVTYIGDYAFVMNNLTSVTIPNSVTHVGNTAFLSNELISVTIGANIELGRMVMGDYAFNEVYERNGKRKGTYSRSGPSAFEEWTYTP